jgi:hypothetical protein
MVAGKWAFEGASAAGVMGAILEREPPALSAIQPLASPALDQLVRQCLAKSPDDPPDTAHDASWTHMLAQRRLGRRVDRDGLLHQPAKQLRTMAGHAAVEPARELVQVVVSAPATPSPDRLSWRGGLAAPSSGCP